MRFKPKKFDYDPPIFDSNGNNITHNPRVTNIRVGQSYQKADIEKIDLYHQINQTIFNQHQAHRCGNKELANQLAKDCRSLLKKWHKMPDIFLKIKNNRKDLGKRQKSNPKLPIWPEIDRLTPGDYLQIKEFWVRCVWTRSNPKLRYEVWHGLQRVCLYRTLSKVVCSDWIAARVTHSDYRDWLAYQPKSIWRAGRDESQAMPK